MKILCSKWVLASPSECLQYLESYDIAIVIRPIATGHVLPSVCPSVILVYHCTPLRTMNGRRCHLAGTLVWSQVTLYYIGSPVPHGKGRFGDRIGDRNPQSKFVLQIAANTLQIAELLLQTAYRNSAMLYPTVPSPTPYDFSSPNSTTQLTPYF